ncbi:MAG TPA: ABC transporter permease, partial [Propionicimonas sp.]|nr:ABC transporter permease [Propionicimonas sp.]
MSSRRIRLLIWKEFIQLRRDPLLIRLLLIMPVMQLIMFGYVVAVDIRHLSTAVVDLDHSSLSHKLETSFSGSGYFTITSHPVDEASLRPLLDRGTVTVALVIPEGTEARILRGEVAPIGIIVDGTDSQVSAVASGYASQIVAQFNTDRIEASGVSIAAPGVEAQVRVMFNPSMDPLNTMIPGLIAVILMLSLMAIMSQAVVKERESGT